VKTIKDRPKYINRQRNNSYYSPLSQQSTDDTSIHPLHMPAVCHSRRQTDHEVRSSESSRFSNYVRCERCLGYWLHLQEM